METLWESKNWQNNQIGKKHLISFLLSSLMLITLLMVPLKFNNYPTTTIKHLTVSLVKVIKKPHKKTSLKEKSTPLSTASPKTIDKSVSKPTKSKKLTPKLAPTKISDKSIKSKLLKNNIPSAITILNSIQNFKSKEMIDSDYQIANDKFIFKNLLKPDVSNLKLDDKIKKAFTVKNTESVVLTKAKSIIGFLFAPINEPDKTIDSVPFCHLYGRRTFHCPSNNPFD